MKTTIGHWGTFIALGIVTSLGSSGCKDDDTGGDAAGSSSSATAGDETTSHASFGSGGHGGTTVAETDSEGATEGSATAGGTTAGTTSSAGDTETTGASASAETEGTSGGSTTGSAEGGEDGGDGDGGDDGTSETPEFCQAPGDLQPCDANTDDPFQAIGLNCPGGPNQKIPIFNESFASPDSTAWRIVRQLGTATDPTNGLPLWRAREGEQFLLISTGSLMEPDENGLLVQPSGYARAGSHNTNDNPDAKALPAPMNPARGSNNGSGGTPFMNCDLFGDCSDSLFSQWQAGDAEANDLLWFQFETMVPKGTYGFSFDFAYFSAEFPDYVGTSYNDMFLVWSNSESYTGNLCFVNDQPCTVTALWPVQHQGTDPALVGTGFSPSGGANGGATGWYQAKGSAVPGELLQLTWAVFDMGDRVLSTSVIVDNFRWDCEGCTPTEVDACIGIDPV